MALSEEERGELTRRLVLKICAEEVPGRADEIKARFFSKEPQIPPDASLLVIARFIGGQLDGLDLDIAWSVSRSATSAFQEMIEKNRGRR